jgi:hypothetical protein
MEIIIYTLTDPFTNEIRYVGKTTAKNYKNRLKAHSNPNQRADSNLHKFNWLKSIIARGGKPVMQILDTTAGEWEWLEQYWISQFRQWGFRLLNMSAGGESPPPNKGWSQENKLKLRQNSKFKKKLLVKTLDGNKIGVWNSTSEFIRDEIKIDRSLNPREYSLWSSKISAVAQGKKWRKSYKGMVYEYVE